MTPIHSALQPSLHGCGVVSVCFFDFCERSTSDRTKDAVDYSRPWAIVRLLPNAQRYIVARFVNRQDADDHKRYLSRFMPAAEFEVIFDAPEVLSLIKRGSELH